MMISRDNNTFKLSGIKELVQISSYITDLQTSTFDWMGSGDCMHLTELRMRADSLKPSV
jgi:hypothetical protein